MTSDHGFKIFRNKNHETDQKSEFIKRETNFNIISMHLIRHDAIRLMKRRRVA
jgi:hypothetical protein